MNGQTWLTNLPLKPGAERSKLVLQAVEKGLAICEWSDIIVSSNQHHAIVRVNTDAVYVDTDHGRFRPQVNAHDLQIIADTVGGCLMTSKVMDASYQQASLKIDCTPMKAGPDMSYTTKSIEYNKLLEQKRNGHTGLFRDCGKTWILDNKLAVSKGAVNHGFYHSAASSISNGIKLYQNAGGMHNAQHEDYSQTILLMASICVVDGQDMLVSDVIQDPELSYLLNYSGILNYIRGL